MSESQISSLGMHIRDLIIYVTQAVICGSVLVFCMVRMCMDITNEERIAYMSTITGIVGYFLPNPKIPYRSREI